MFSTPRESGAAERPSGPPARRWRLLQVETTIDCRLDCIMCPWHGVRAELRDELHMRPEVWAAIVPHLPEVASIDFSGGGEPLLQPRLREWIEQARAAGCETGFLSNGFQLDADLTRSLLAAGVDWIAVSLDGAAKATYEEIRRGSDFARVRENLVRLGRLRSAGKPRTMINFVLMPINFHEVEGIVRLAAELGVDKVNFKQCDVIRGGHGRGLGVFAAAPDRRVRRLEKALARARKLAARLGVATEAFSFVPRERPVCEQDPRDSLFIRHDGRVSACINLAYGGPSEFFGRAVEMPTCHYGRLPQDDLLDIWESEACLARRRCFEDRAVTYERKILDGFVGTAPSRYQETLAGAARAMPEAAAGCGICHYLHDV